MIRKTGFRKGAGFFKLAMRLIALTLIFAAAASPCTAVRAAQRLQDTGDKLVIVIDPGHGGDNLGTTENGHEEKYMTMTTALAMYEELSLYDGVEVYLTRTDDRDLSRKERAEFAKSVGADFMFSIHYNASENHDAFGSEVWTSAFAPYNGYGYQFGYELLSDMSKKGLFVRGVKTRLGQDGKDYYGIILYAAEMGFPSVIIEHCHVDEERDAGYCDTEEELKEFGRMDATAAARYFGLKSSVLGVDYSGYSLTESDDSALVASTVVDTTAPELCRIDLKDTDYATGELSLSVTAGDQDSLLLYYSYSLDGGQTFSKREPWPGADALTGTCPDGFTLDLTVPDGASPRVVLRVYNLYDMYTESNVYESPMAYHYVSQDESVEAAAPAVSEKEELTEPSLQDASGEKDSRDGESGLNIRALLVICLMAASALLLIMLVYRAIRAIFRI